MKKYTLSLLKVAVVVAILVWLAVDVRRNDPETFSQIRNQPKDWGRLVTALLLCFGAVSITIFRWFFLVRALHIPFHVRDAVRLGFMGYLFNFVALGNVGGDLFKALFLAREQQTRRIEAVATIVVDRMIGLYALLIVTSSAVLFLDPPRSIVQIRLIADATLLLTAIGTIAILLAVFPGYAQGKLAACLERIPRVGRTIQRLNLAFRMYRGQKKLLFGLGVMSVVVHGLSTASIYLSASALFFEVPTLLEHFIICPMANVVGALPISPSGLGTYEFAMRYLYDHLPAGGVGEGKGLVVALSYRVMQISVACIGIVFYYFNRRKVSEVFHASDSNAQCGPERAVRDSSG